MMTGCAKNRVCAQSEAAMLQNVRRATLLMKTLMMDSRPLNAAVLKEIPAEYQMINRF